MIRKMQIGVLFAALAAFLVACGVEQRADAPDEAQNGSPPQKADGYLETRPILGPQCMREEDRGAGQPSPYCGELQTMAAVNIREAKLEVVVDGFKYPWAFEFLNENEVIVTEFRGVLIRVNLETGKKTVIKGLPEMEVGKGQRGLNDIALHPRFHENGLIYFSYAMKNDDDPEGNLYASAVARARLVGDRLEDAETIFVAEPYSSSPSNFGGALEFDKTGRLLFGIGDRSLKEQSQIPTVFIGKIVRLTDSGGVPEDNPFVGDTSGVRPEIFVLGVRNPQGLVYDAERDVIFETEHGPMGGDEVNVIVAGKNYGWPTITYGMDYIYSKTGIGAAAEGLEQPLYFYLPSRAISPITVYRGAMFEEWDGDLLVGALRGRSVSRLKVVDGAVKSEMQILDELDDRVRDIKVAQDGAIWILTQADGALYRLSRDRMAVQQQKTAMIPGKRTGEQIYGLICSSCHSRNIDDVPPLKDAQAWRTRLAKGRNVLYQNTFDGMGAMPPRGFCEDCTDEELRSAVDFILAQTNQ